MKKNSSLIRNILFNLLVILTIILIYLLFFPKKSYVESKLNNELNPVIEETFNQNTKSMEIASTNYFNEFKEEKTVTLKQLIEKNLLVDLKDSNGNTCNSDKSYAEKEDNKILIYLNCNEKEGTTEIIKENTPSKENNNFKDSKLLCLYEYTKKLPDTYTNWSEFTEWSTEIKESDELTNVETKVEQVLDGTKTITETKQVNIEATEKTRQYCPSGYTLSNGKCIKETKANSIRAAFTYTCPEGYNRKGIKCYKNSTIIDAKKTAHCPNNKEYIKFKLENDKCNVINVEYEQLKTEKYYTCPNGYKLSGTKCYMNKTIEKEIDNYKEVTYYKYQTREKNEAKYDIKWSTLNDKNLLENEYNMSRKIFCEF